LTPGSTNYFQIDSVTDDAFPTFQGMFLTSDVSAESPYLYSLFSAPDLTLYWNGTGRTLQTATSMGPEGKWTDVSAQPTVSPYVITKEHVGTVYFRLR